MTGSGWGRTMFASALRSETGEAFADLPASVRVDARLKLHVRAEAGVTRLCERHEAGAFRFRFPRAHGRPPEAVLVNIAGGLAGGDRVASAISVGEGASLSLTSAAAERIYRSAGSVTELSATLDVADRGTLFWLPQETILHDGARVFRRFSVDLAPAATLVLGEMLYFGRRASGEGFAAGAVRESWRIRRAGRLVLADETRLDGDFSEAILRPAALHRHVAVATLLLAHPDAGEHLQAIRAALPEEPGLEAGASLVEGLVLVRIACDDAARLRAVFLSLAAGLARRFHHPFPRAFSN